MATNIGEALPDNSGKDRVQIQHPVTRRYIKIDTRTGRIVEEKKTAGPYKGIKDITGRR